MSNGQWVGVVASSIGILPVLWLGMLKRRVDPAWWWLALAFGLSFVVDMAALITGKGWVLSFVYPVTQTGVIVAVFRPRQEAIGAVALLSIIGVGSALFYHGGVPELMLRTAAWGGIVAIVYQIPALGRLRWALLCYFGLGLLAWYGYAWSPGWTSWGSYQAVRLAGVLLFCQAASHPVPTVRLATS